MLNWMILPLKRYAEVSGRSRRMEYWSFRLFELLSMFGGFLLVGAIGAFVGAIAGKDAGDLVAGILVVFLGLYVLALIIPGITVTVRRLHDTGKSGWTLLLGLVPLIGPILLLVFLLTDGDRGDNAYGPDPKAPETESHVFS